MKWMQGWSQQDYDAADPELINEIILMMREEQEEYEKSQREAELKALAAQR